MAKLERTEKPVSVILQDIKTGEYGLPEIQRGYVWKGDRVRDLIESLYKEYPCGLLLLWKPPQDLLDNVELRDFLISPRSLKSKKPIFLILDGQQRLTSLVIARYGNKAIEHFDMKEEILEKINRMDVYFNVEDEKFEIKSPKIKNQPFWISVTEILERGAIEVWQDLCSKHSDVPKEKINEYLKRLDKIQKIKDYVFPVSILHTDDYGEITEAFIRINSKGVTLREAELALAQLALKLPGIVSKDFDEALDEYKENNFEFEARFLIRCFVAVATGQSKYKFLSKLWKASKQELINYWEVTKKGLDYTINFLRNNVGIESTDWIPSINALVPLVVYFAKNTHLSDAEEKLLLFWYYSANMWARYSSSVETKLDQDLDVLVNKQTGELKDGGIETLVRNCRSDVADLIVDEEELIELYQRSAFMPLLFAIIRKKRAKDWFNGIELSATNVGPDNKIELHHFFPRSVLKKANLARKDHDDFSNIVFLSQRANREIRNSLPLKYIKKYNIERKRLEDQFIPIDENLWKLENFDKFLEVRRKNIAKAMNDYLMEFGKEYMDK